MPTNIEYHTILDHAPDIVVVHTLSGQIQYLSSAYYHLLGYTDTQTLPDNWYALLHPDDAVRAQAFYAKLSQPLACVVSYRVRNVKNAYLWFEARAQYLNEGNDPPTVITIARPPLNDLPPLFSILKDYPERAHQAYLGIIGRLLSSMIHELNQPVSAIMNYMSGCLRRLDNPEAETDIKELLQQPMEQVKKQADRVHQTLQSLRNFVELNELQPRQVDVNELLQQVIFMLDGQIQTQAVVLEWALAADLPTAYADPVLLEQALLNLLRYVMDTLHESAAMPQHIYLYTQHLPEDAVIQITLRHHGQTEHLAPVSDHKYDFFANAAEQVELSMSQLIIHAHNGILNKMNQPNDMTEYSFTLPIVAEEEQTA